jgi:N-acetylmuramoyl-L-alanine amidase
MLKNKVPVLILFAASHLLIFPAFSQTPKIKTIIVDAGHGGQDFGATGQYENSLRSKEKDITLEISKKLVAELKRQLPDVNIVPTRTTDIYQNPREKAQIANDNKGNLFICIHADSGPLKTGHRQIGTKMVTRYKITHTGKGKKRKTIKTPYQVEEAVYEYFKMPLTRNGTSVWIFAAHKTSDKLKAIMKEIGDFDVEADGSDSTYQPFDINSTEGRNLANIYATRFQLRSDRLATFVNDEIEKTGRPALGVNQRQVGIWVLQATNMPAILVETGFINNPDDERYLNSDKGQQELAESITEAVKRYKDQVENSNKPLATTTTSTPEKPKDEKIIPQVYENRATKETKVLQVKSNKVKVEIYDDGEIDNDIVSVSFNKTMIVEGKTLTAKPHTLNLELQEGKTNELVLYADNLGDIPPNTALMVITDGTSRYEVRLSADMKNNASIKFELKK